MVPSSSPGVQGCEHSEGETEGAVLDSGTSPAIQGAGHQLQSAKATQPITTAGFCFG